MSNRHGFVKKVARPTNKVLTSEVASASTDPQFYSALYMLPNPDPVLRKLGRAQDAYEAIGYDGHVMGELRAMHGSLLKRKWKLMPGGDSPSDIAAFELCEKLLDKSPSPNSSWSNLIWNVFQAVYKGYSVAEVIWQREGNYIVPCMVKDKPNRRFGFGAEKELRLLSKFDQAKGEPVEAMKFLLTRHMHDYDNPYGKAVFSACFWPYTFKHNGMRWFSKMIQRFAVPSTVGRYPQGTTPDKQQELLQAIMGMIEDNSIVIPQGTEIELLEVKGSSQAPHEGFVNTCNREMSKALTSQTIASEVTEAGSRSTAETQQGRSDNNSDADAEMVQRTFQQLCDWTTQINFIDAKPPKWIWHEDEEVSESQAKTIKTATEIVPVREDEVYQRLQLTKPKEGDAVIYNGAPTVGPQDAQFNRHSCGREFAAQGNDQISRLANRGVAAAKPSIENMVSAVKEFAEKADSLDELDDELPGLLDSVDIDDFVEAMQDTKVISNALGADDAAE